VPGSGLSRRCACLHQQHDDGISNSSVGTDLHLNDLDHKSGLKKLTGGFIRYTHPKAELYLWCSQPLSVKRGYTVTKVDYEIRKQENYQKKADRGNNFALTTGPREKVKNAVNITVIAPEKPEIIRKDGILTVNGVPIRL